METKEYFRKADTIVECSTPKSSIGVNCPMTVMNRPVDIKDYKGVRIFEHKSTPYYVAVAFIGSPSGKEELWYYQPYDKKKAQKDYAEIVKKMENL